MNRVVRALLVLATIWGSVVAVMHAPSRVAAKEVVSAGGVGVDEQTSRLFLLSPAYPTNQPEGGSARVLVFDTRTGALLAETPVGPAAGSLQVDAGANRDYVLSGSDYRLRTPGTVSILDATTGALRGRISVGRYPVAMAVDDRNGHLFVATNGDTGGYAARVSMIDVSSGRVLRSTFVGHYPSAMAVDERLDRLFVAGDYRLLVLDARSGRLLSTIAAGIHPSRVLVNEQANRVFLFNSGGSVTVLDAATGAAVSTVQVGATGFESVEPDTRIHDIVVTTLAWQRFAGQLSFLDDRGGKLMRAIDVGTLPLAMSIAADAGRIFLLSADRSGASSLRMMSAHDDRTVRVIPLLTAPGGVEVDNHAGHVFVIDYNGVTMFDAITGSLLHHTVYASTPG